MNVYGWLVGVEWDPAFVAQVSLQSTLDNMWSMAPGGMPEMIGLIVSKAGRPEPGSPWAGLGKAGKTSPGLRREFVLATIQKTLL